MLDSLSEDGPRVQDMNQYRKVRLLNVDVDDVTMDELVSEFRQGLLMTLHADMIMKLQHHAFGEVFHQIIHIQIMHKCVEHLDVLVSLSHRIPFFNCLLFWRTTIHSCTCL